MATAWSTSPTCSRSSQTGQTEDRLMRFHAPILSTPHSALSTFQRSRAFTLTEVLVTLGAIVLLIGLLAPALSSVGASSRSLQCQTNLRQICIASQNYAAIYQIYPPA